jgi:hypothetical protein
MLEVPKLDGLWIQLFPSKEVASFPVAPAARYVPSSERPTALIVDDEKVVCGND